MRLVDRRYGYKWYKIRDERDYVLHCRILGYTHKSIARMLRRRKEYILELDSVKIREYEGSTV